MSRPAWLEEWVHKTLLPPNATDQELALEATIAAGIDAIGTPIRNVWNPDTCPVDLLPWLAWAFHVDFWDSNWTEAQKRSFIKNALYIHKHKGTIGAMRRAMESIGYSFRILEWFQMDPPGTPYTFEIEITISDEGVTQSTYDKVELLVRDAKNVRSQFSRLVIGGEVDGSLNFGSAILCGEETSITM